MKHVRCEFTSPTSYHLIVIDGELTLIRNYKCELIIIPNGQKDEVINPTHNEAWVRMNLEAGS